jgi:hypothetical protein
VFKVPFSKKPRKIGKILIWKGGEFAVFGLLFLVIGLKMA